MAKLSTHVLDTARGRPAAGVGVRLSRGGVVVAEAVTNADGRTDGPLLAGEEIPASAYTLEFAVGDYHRGLGDPDAGRFLEVVRIDFVVADGRQGYHVPLLVSPWAYSTYRGS